MKSFNREIENNIRRSFNFMHNEIPIYKVQLYDFHPDNTRRVSRQVKYSIKLEICDLFME